MGEDTLNGVIDITEGPAFRRGADFVVANGSRIPNLGERKLIGYTEEGIANTITAQICVVNQTLMSVSKIVGCGNRVVFDDDGSYIEEKSTGTETWLKYQGGYVLPQDVGSRKTIVDAGV